MLFGFVAFCSSIISILCNDFTHLFFLCWIFTMVFWTYFGKMVSLITQGSQYVNCRTSPPKVGWRIPSWTTCNQYDEMRQAAFFPRRFLPSSFAWRCKRKLVLHKSHPVIPLKYTRRKATSGIKYCNSTVSSWCLVMSKWAFRLAIFPTKWEQMTSNWLGVEHPSQLYV